MYDNAIRLGIRTIPAYESLQWDRQPLLQHYKDDLLHLNETGADLLRMTLSKYVAKERIRYGFRRTKREAPETEVCVSHAKAERRRLRNA